MNKGLQEIGYSAFEKCTSLAIIKVPSTVTEIGTGAFNGCTNLSVVVLGEGLKKIGAGAFYGCASMAFIKVPSTVTEIGAGAFNGCINLSEVVLNEGSLRKIGVRAFRKCTSLKQIKLPSTVILISTYAFFGCTTLREVLLNEGLQQIEFGAFYNCTSLTIIKLPSTVTCVVDFAFAGCINLKEVVLNECLQKIERSVFKGCINLMEVILNEGLQKIGDGAFAECPRLAVVKFPWISIRAKNLIDTGITEIEDKITTNQYLEWRGGEILGSCEAIRPSNWKATRTNLDRVLSWVSYYELREATTTIELALWKIKIEEMGAATVEERDACLGEVPGPVKDAIIQYLKVDIGVDVDESDDSSQYSNSSGEDESGDDWLDPSNEDENN